MVGAVSAAGVPSAGFCSSFGVGAPIETNIMTDTKTIAMISERIILFWAGFKFGRSTSLFLGIQ